MYNTKRSLTMEKNMLEEVNKFFTSVCAAVDNVAASYVHPKRLAEVTKTKERVIKVQKLINQAFNSKDSREIYQLINMRHHPDYNVNPEGFMQPYSNSNDNELYLAYVDVVNKICDYVYHGEMYEKPLLKAIKKWNFKKVKSKEYDFVPVVEKFLDDVSIYVNKNVAKYTMPKSKEECEEGIKKMDSIRADVEQLIKMPDLEYKELQNVTNNISYKSFALSKKLFTDPKHPDNYTMYRIFEGVLNGISNYYKDNMQKPELILVPLKRWYLATSGNIIEKLQNRFKTLKSYTVIENQK